MRIRTAVKNGYKINPSAMLEELQRLKKYCERLEFKADMLRKSVPPSHSDIVSVNYEKTREIVERMLKTVNASQIELGELISSCEAFSEKIERIKKIKFQR